MNKKIFRRIFRVRLESEPSIDPIKSQKQNCQPYRTSTRTECLRVYNSIHRFVCKFNFVIVMVRSLNQTIIGPPNTHGISDKIIRTLLTAALVIDCYQSRQNLRLLKLLELRITRTSTAKTAITPNTGEEICKHIACRW